MQSVVDLSLKNLNSEPAFKPSSRSRKPASRVVTARTFSMVRGVGFEPTKAFATGS